MRSRLLLPLVTLAALAAPASASAYFGHVVAAGESLSSVAAADGLSVAQLAAANGLAADAQLTAGSTLQIPPQDGVANAAPSTSSAGASSASSDSAQSTSSVSGDYVVQPGDTLSGLAARSGVTVDQLAAANGLSPDGLLIAGATLQTQSQGGVDSSAQASSSTSSGSGGYTVQPGDTLSGIAAQAGVSVDQLAAANGLDPAGILPAGAVLNVSGSSGSAVPVSMTTPAPAPSTSASGSVQPTPETVSPGQVGQIAAANGVSPSLAEAIGYQESGFNNNLVSSTGATGVMQIEPGTWNYIGQNLATPPPLSSASAQDNIRGGVLLLHSLLNQTGGDPALAAAGYYQGMQSVRQHGMYTETQHYVNNVMALMPRFGGP